MKRIFALIIVLAMCLTALAGCDKKEPAANPDNPDKPSAAQTDGTGDSVPGTIFDTGSVQALVPQGWMGFPEKDLFADDPNALNPDVIIICKDAKSDLDMFTQPYVRIDYYGPDRDLWEPTKDWYDEAKDLEPQKIGPYTWQGFQGLSAGMPMVILWTEDGEHEYQASLICEASNGKISLEDADVQAILASIAPSGGSVGSAQSSSEPEDMDEDPVAEIASPYSWWEGDWYGWWCVYSASGIYEDMEDVAWDAYATITLTGEDAGTIEIWDTETGNGSYFATCGVSFGSGVTEYGCMMSESGTFYGTGSWLAAFPMPSEIISHADWIIDPGASTVSHFDQMIEIEGRYEDPEDDDNRIDYYVFLRPWGMEWEDVRTGDTSGCIYNDMMPLYYDDWYLPLLNAGTAQMPATFAEGGAMLDGSGSVPADSVQAPADSGQSAASPSGFGGEHTATLADFMTDIPADFTFTLPESGWVLEVYSDSTIYLYNVPTPDDAYSNSPRIQFELKDSLDKVNFYKDDFENLKEIDSRTIGGIEMKGRTYKNVGMEWIEYYGELPSGIWVTVKISDVSIDSGSEGSAILDSVSIQ